MSPAGPEGPWDVPVPLGREMTDLDDVMQVSSEGLAGRSGAAVAATVAAFAVVPGVIGVGIDVVAVERFSAALVRTPALAARLFADPERVTSSGHPRGAASLAARFAVKEAVAKALGVPAGMDWHDCAVLSESSGRPTLAVSGTVADACAAAGIRDWRISLSHDAGIAAAIVIGLG